MAKVSPATVVRFEASSDLKERTVDAHPRGARKGRSRIHEWPAASRRLIGEATNALQPITLCLFWTRLRFRLRLMIRRRGEQES